MNFVDDGRPREILYYTNYDDETIATPVNWKVLNDLLVESDYPIKERIFIVNGFKNGFSLGYRGPKNVKIKSPNLKLNVGDEIELWNKVMKEVKEKRYVGPFQESKIPFKNYIQSPIGLVPKDGGKSTRLIFHLSYPKKPNSSSVNTNVPKHLCSVSYPDFAEAIKLCMDAGHFCYISRSDMKSAFRQLGISKRYWRYLLLKARSPLDGKYYFFYDKATPFGGAISCSNFQRFSNCVAHIVTFKTGKKLVNYLDDYLFVALLKLVCNWQMDQFMHICSLINFPISIEKTFWASTCIIFLGFMINSETMTVSVPCDKLTKAKNMIEYILNQKKRPIKIKVLQLQKICGFLNFIGRAIIPGRAFTRRLYSKLTDKLKAHHHIRVDSEMQADLAMWLRFVQHPAAFSRPFMDYSSMLLAEEMDFYVDASKNKLLGFGGYSDRDWMQCAWSRTFILQCNPSIAYLELFAMTAAILAWAYKYQNHRLIVYTDNEGVEAMINNNSSKCKNCMILIRLIVMHSLVHNVRFFARHVSSSRNGIADSLSRLQNARFRRLTRGKHMNKEKTPVPAVIWPPESIWLFN